MMVQRELNIYAYTQIFSLNTCMYFFVLKDKCRKRKVNHNVISSILNNQPSLSYTQNIKNEKEKKY